MKGLAQFVRVGGRETINKLFVNIGWKPRDLAGKLKPLPARPSIVPIIPILYDNVYTSRIVMSSRLGTLQCRQSYAIRVGAS